MSHQASARFLAVASNTPHPAFTPAVRVDEADARGQHFPWPTDPVVGIAPVDGWELRCWESEDGDGFFVNEYVARSATRDIHLDVSRFNFTPSQGRFAWLVRNGFPPRPEFGPWDDTDIEARITAEAV